MEKYSRSGKGRSGAPYMVNLGKDCLLDEFSRKEAAGNPMVDFLKIIR